MKRFFALMICLCLCAMAVDKKTFFSGPTEVPANLPANELFPKGQLLPFGFYSFGGGSDSKRGELLTEEQRHADQDYITKNGCITLIGPAYELNDCVIADAKRSGLKCAYTMHSIGKNQFLVDGYNLGSKDGIAKMLKEKGEPNWEGIRAEIANIMKAVGNSPEIAVWNLVPEEVRPWKKQEIAILKFVAKTVRELDPLKRPCALYLPNHYGAGTMKNFFPPLDISWRGMYVNYAGKKDKRIWARWCIEQQLVAIKDQPGAVCWGLPEMFKNPKDPADVKNIPTWVRHDVYVALAAGAKGILIFSGSRRSNFAENRKIYLDAYLQVSKELNGPKALAQIYMFGEPKNDLTLSITEGPESIHFNNQKTEINAPPLCMSNMAWKNARYLTIVNSCDQQVTAMLDGLPYGSDVGIEDVMAEKPSFMVVPEGNTELVFKPWEVKILKVYCKE
ncbi:MAG: hypothetical protein IJS08_16160 [Victivallales bacterium]|nr:hypothetical protein [Victivallales bacterium]